MRLKLWHCLVILALAALVAYYPSLRAGYCSVDDVTMITYIDNAGPIDLVQQFFPQNNRYYYRPLNTLSYYIDRDVWGTIPSFMHLENVLLHLGCVFFVFGITRRITRYYPCPGESVPLLSALLFALHPMAAESVCWISGRTDLLAGFFLLLALWLLILGLQTKRLLASVLSGVSLLLACLAKEVAVFILPGLLWMIAVFPEAGLTWLQRLYRRWLSLTVPVVAIATYFVMRSLAGSSDTGIGTALKGVATIDYDLLNKVRVAFKVYGFYFKKVFVPWPLNFGIAEISGWYVLAGVLLALLLLRFALRRDLLGAFVLMSFCVLSPALLVTFGKMAWTLLAERYLYIPLALLAPPMAIWLFIWHSRLSPLGRRRGTVVLAALLLLFFSTTLHRAWIWQDNLRLAEDTVAKSSESIAAKAELASVLMMRGKVGEAEVILKGMQTDSGSSGYAVSDFNLASIFLARGEFDKARGILIPLLNPESKFKNRFDLLQALLRINAHRAVQAETPDLKRAIQEESLSWLEEQMRMRPRPFTLYRIGKMQFAMGDEVAALISFRASLAKAPIDAHYRGATEIYIKKLEGL